VPETFFLIDSEQVDELASIDFMGFKDLVVVVYTGGRGGDHEFFLMVLFSLLDKFIELLLLLLARVDAATKFTFKKENIWLGR